MHSGQAHMHTLRILCECRLFLFFSSSILFVSVPGNNQFQYFLFIIERPFCSFQNIEDTSPERNPRSTDKRNPIRIDRGRKHAVHPRLTCILSAGHHQLLRSLSAGWGAPFFPGCWPVDRRSFVLTVNPDKKSSSVCPTLRLSKGNCIGVNIGPTKALTMRSEQSDKAQKATDISQAYAVNELLCSLLLFRIKCTTTLCFLFAQCLRSFILRPLGRGTRKFER